MIYCFERKICMSELNVKYPSANVKIIIDNGIVNKEWSFLNREFRYIVYNRY